MKQSFWQFFKQYLYIALGFIAVSFWMFFDIEDAFKWFAIFPLLIGLVVIPAFAWLSYNDKIQ